MSSISSSYNNKSLGFTEPEKKNLDWDKYPVEISSQEMETLKNFPNIIKIISKESQSPFEILGLKAEDILVDVIRDWNDEYTKSIDKYRELLQESCKLDKKNIESLKRNYFSNYILSYIKGSGIGGLAGGGLGALAGLLLGPVGMLLAGGMLLGGGGGLCSTYSDVKSDIIKKGYTHRFSWLQKIDTLEIERFQKIKHDLRLAATPLVENLMDINKDNEVDKRYFGQLWQLQQIFEGMFPNETLEVEISTKKDKKNVMDFLTSLDAEHIKNCKKSLMVRINKKGSL
jgi:hypothetical protein